MLSRYFQYFYSRIFTKAYDYGRWREQNYKLQKIILPKTSLTKNLEKLCAQKGGVLTFGEFISEEMFGENGYYKTHKDFGKTPVARTWSKSILSLCRKHSLNYVFEVGSGDGSLGKETLKFAKKTNQDVAWVGVEKNKSLWTKINNNKPKNFSLSESVSELKPQRNLTIFPYSLDSMSNEIIINNTLKNGAANSLIGIKIQNGVLEEVFLSESELKQKEIFFRNGVLKINGFSFDFSEWILHPNQRAYLPIEGFLAIIECVQKMKPSSIMLIIDEMKAPPFALQAYHLGTPRILNSPIRDYDSLTEAYKNLGNNLWYFPMYLKPLLQLLKEAGFSDIKSDIEEKMAANIKGDSWNKPGFFLCTSVVAKLSNVSLKNSFKVHFPA